MKNNADFWFARVDINVARDKSLSVMARFIFTILCTFADKDKRGCWPSNTTVAETAGVSERTLRRAYKELEARGVISRETRFANGLRASSYTHIVGHNASCYVGDTDGQTGGTPVADRTRIKEQDIKDSLKREAELPNFTDMPMAFENGQPVTPEEAPGPDNPKEVCTPDEAPEIMQPTAEYLLHKTGRKALTWEEISALRDLSVTQYPTRVQKEIKTAVKRFLRLGRSLSTLTFGYIAGSLSHQPTRTRKRKHKTEVIPEIPVCTDEQADAEMAEIEALQAKFDRESAAIREGTCR